MIVCALGERYIGEGEKWKVGTLENQKEKAVWESKFNKDSLDDRYVLPWNIYNKVLTAKIYEQNYFLQFTLFSSYIFWTGYIHTTFTRIKNIWLQFSIVKVLV